MIVPPSRQPDKHLPAVLLGCVLWELGLFLLKAALWLFQPYMARIGPDLEDAGADAGR